MKQWNLIIYRYSIGYQHRLICARTSHMKKFQDICACTHIWRSFRTFAHALTWRSRTFAHALTYEEASGHLRTHSHMKKFEDICAHTYEVWGYLHTHSHMKNLSEHLRTHSHMMKFQDICTRTHTWRTFRTFAHALTYDEVWGRLRAHTHIWWSFRTFAHALTYDEVSGHLHTHSYKKFEDICAHTHIRSLRTFAHALTYEEVQGHLRTHSHIRTFAHALTYDEVSGHLRTHSHIKFQDICARTHMSKAGKQDASQNISLCFCRFNASQPKLHASNL